MKVYDKDKNIVFEHDGNVITTFFQVDENNSQCVTYDDATKEELFVINHNGPDCKCLFNMLPDHTPKTRKQLESELLDVKDVEWNPLKEFESKLKEVK